jgi:sirohydrochlorin cobaltochelatase
LAGIKKVDYTVHSSAPIHGTILFAHGSRDPLWRQSIEAVANRARQLEPQTPVRCAYLELTEPDLPSCAAELVGTGVQSITVVPMFLGVGRHAREDLPVLIANLKATYPQIAIKLQIAIGEDDRLIELMATIALS